MFRRRVDITARNQDGDLRFYTYFEGGSSVFVTGPSKGCITEFHEGELDYAGFKGGPWFEKGKIFILSKTKTFIIKRVFSATISCDEFDIVLDVRDKIKND